MFCSKHGLEFWLLLLYSSGEVRINQPSLTDSLFCLFNVRQTYLNIRLYQIVIKLGHGNSIRETTAIAKPKFKSFKFEIISLEELNVNLNSLLHWKLSVRISYLSLIISAFYDFYWTLTSWKECTVACEIYFHILPCSNASERMRKATETVASYLLKSAD